MTKKQLYLKESRETFYEELSDLALVLLKSMRTDLDEGKEIEPEKIDLLAAIFPLVNKIA